MIGSEYASVKGVKLVDRHSGYPGARALDEGNLALLAGNGGTNLYIEGTLAEIHETLLRLTREVEARDITEAIESLRDDES